MAIRIVEIHPAEDDTQLNTEWIVLANEGDKPFSTKNCSLGVARGGGRPKSLGTIDPGFVIAPGGKARVVTGNPGRKAHGKPAEDDVQNYHLFLGSPMLRGPGTVVALSLRTHELARAVFDPEAVDGIGQ